MVTKDDAPHGEAVGAGGWRRAGMAAVMALTIVAGVGVALVLPHRAAGPPAVELAKPAPVAEHTPPAWWARPPQPSPAQAPPAVNPAPAPSPTAAPAIRTRRLGGAQVASAHAAKPVPPVIQIHAPRGAGARRPGPCAAPVSVADRLVCQRPTLAAQDRAMRAAYDRALASGADRLKIDRAQARWRGERDRATTEAEVARLYAVRIAELDRAARRRGGGDNGGFGV